MREALDSVVAVVERYQEAVNTRNPSKFREVLALDDSRFTEIEDHIPEPFGSERANSILEWIKEHPDSGYRVRYYDIQAFLLSETVAYAVAMHQWTNSGRSGRGRTTFIMIKYGADWQIVHGHWSEAPGDGA